MMLPIREVSTTCPLPVFSRAYNAAVTPQASMSPPISSPMPGSIEDGGLLRFPGAHHETGPGNPGVIERELGRVRAFSAPTGRMRVDKTRVSFQQHFRPDPHFDGRVNAHVRDEYIRLVDELQEDFHALLGFQVHGDASLVAVVAFKIIIRTLETRCGADQAHKAARRIAFLRFHFDDIGSKISQPCSRFRSLLEHCDFYYSNTGQRSWHSYSS